MRSASFRLAVVLSIAFLGRAPRRRPQVDISAAIPAFGSIGPLTFGADGVLFAADAQGATIYAVKLGSARPAGAAGHEGDSGDRHADRGAARHRRRARSPVTDLAVHPKNAQRVPVGDARPGRGREAGPAARRRRRRDRGGRLRSVKFTKVALPNAPRRDHRPRTARRSRSPTWRSPTAGCTWPGLSNEEFASKLRSMPYPFAAADRGTSVEIFHGNHGQFETRSPVYTFVPYTVNNRRT